MSSCKDKTRSRKTCGQCMMYFETIKANALFCKVANGQPSSDLTSVICMGGVSIQDSKKKGEGGPQRV